MARLPKQYLRKIGGDKTPIKLLDLAILLFYVHRAAIDKDIGFVDARETLDSITKHLNIRTYVDPSLIESGLWSANMLDEQGKFVHPLGLNFQEWLKRVIGDLKYSKIYGTVERKD